MVAVASTFVVLVGSTLAGLGTGVLDGVFSSPDTRACLNASEDDEQRERERIPRGSDGHGPQAEPLGGSCYANRKPHAHYCVPRSTAACKFDLENLGLQAM